MSTSSVTQPIMSLFWSDNVFITLGILFGIMLLIGLIANASTKTQPLAKKPVAKVVVPVMQPKAVAPKISKVEKLPVFEPKSFEIAAPVAPIVEAPVEAPVEVAIEAAPIAVAVETANDVDKTYESYRQAMLSSGPRQMEEEARAEIQSKAGFPQWRHQTAALRRQLNSEDAGSFLERANVSVNDRMVAIFDSVSA